MLKKKNWSLLFLGVIILISGIILIGNKNITLAAGSPLQISPLNANRTSPCGIFYSPAPYSFTYNGGTVWLSGQSDGNGNIYTDDKIDIEVTRPDGTKVNFSKNYGNGTSIVSTSPQNVTSLFQPGNNNVKVTMTDISGPICNSSQYWLVETSGSGGGSAAPKPAIKPRSSWHGPSSGQITPQNADHIVIHHTASTNDPGNLGSRASELFLAFKLDPAGVITGRFNPVNTLSKFGDGQYASIRNTWEGEIWKIWADHKYVENFGDIGYHYFVDPHGNIYEGRFKGPLVENADNKGVSVQNANTGVVSISVLGRYGADGASDSLTAAFDGGINQPTNASIASIRSLINWLSGKYQISKTGMYYIQNGCKLSSNLCYVNNISGHKDFNGKTLNSDTACPGDNIYRYLSTFRGEVNQQGTGTVVAHKAPKGILIGGFSPIELGIVDPSSNRLGFDPASGQNVTNIAEGVYGKLQMFESESHNSAHDPYWLHIPNPTSGVYKIDVVGTGTGNFTLAAEDLESSNTMAMKGSTTTGSKDNYQIIYSLTNPDQIELFHDNVPPITTGKMTCSRDMLGICRSEATINLTAIDTGSNGDPGSGVDKIQCSYDNKATWQQCGNASGGQWVINTNGKTSFWYRSIDRVQNIEDAKYSGVIEIQRYLSIADTLFKTDFATTLKTTGITQSNGNVSFNYNTTVNFDILRYIGAFTQSNNTTFTINQNNKVTTPTTLPAYPLSYYKTRCTNYTGPITLWDTGTAFNKCIYATGDVTINTTNTSGKLTIISEGFIKDKSTGANIQAWDTQNGIMFYSAKGYSTSANKATYTGVIYAPTTQVSGSFSNTTFNGGMYSKTVSFGTGTSLTAIQAAGFPPTTFNLPL